jgi:hypothetical protein
MKTKFILLVAVFCVNCCVYSQSSDHLTFKGVPIDGSLNEYISKMKQEGFTHLGTENGTAILNGDLQDIRIVMLAFLL